MPSDPSETTIRERCEWHPGEGRWAYNGDDGCPWRDAIVAAVVALIVSSVVSAITAWVQYG